ncbi:response regulator [Chlorogloeopsis sp. ULAP01]|uniref:response regulator n=1 Tax=Chlorogloeopsis sp. ULAP01 TaxID=3056483 RepID=UPI0025AB1A49|nr:response regulator [Chlorogloeopsis sp. ULAP01]MDM9381441.1 response regulator [Chlorogloeopsis sp. ULAP01]
MSDDHKDYHLKDDRKDFQSLDGLRILVVDDDEDTRTFITFVLEENSAQVTTAASALEALKVIKQFQPHLVITDLAMPEVDGYSLLSQIRTLNPPLGNIPAIAVTAIDLQKESYFHLQCGFQGYLLKPVDPTDLVIEIVKLIQQPNFTEK